jgi:folate-binding protein YgfZ
MPTSSYEDGNLSIWRGADVLKFIDGLSTNHVLDLRKGEFRHTTFTTAQAKVIDRVGLFHMGEFIAVLSHQPFWKNLLTHISPRILGQDVSVSDATENNNFFVQFTETGPNPKEFVSQNGITTARSTSHYNLLVCSKNTEVTVDSTMEAFHQWRIEHTVPWAGYEITRKYHAYACGLIQDVHESKGCYIGQELLTRMRTRNKMGRKLVSMATIDAKETEITTRGANQSLAIVRD